MYLTLTKKEKVYLEQFYSILTGLFLFMYCTYFTSTYLFLELSEVAQYHRKSF